MRTLEIEKRCGPKSGLWQIHLLAQIGESILSVAETVQKNQNIGRKVIFGRCVDIISVNCGKSDNDRMIYGITALVRVDPWTLKAGFQA